MAINKANFILFGYLVGTVVNSEQFYIKTEEIGWKLKFSYKFYDERIPRQKVALPIQIFQNLLYHLVAKPRVREGKSGKVLKVLDKIPV